MNRRFQGDGGHRLFIDAFAKQDTVQKDESISTTLVSSRELVSFPACVEIVVQDHADSSVYSVLAGEANVFASNRLIGESVSQGG